jgi:hypothetical protein
MTPEDTEALNAISMMVAVEMNCANGNQGIPNAVRRAFVIYDEVHAELSRRAALETDAKAKLKAALRDANEWRQACISVCELHSAYLKAQWSATAVAAEQMIEEYRKRAMNQTSTEGEAELAREACIRRTGAQ